MHLGRGKLQDILIIGPANCGKTSLLKPISLVYRSFVNPAHFISQLQRPTMPKAYFLRETDQYLQQVPLSYSLLDMVSGNTETEMMEVQWKFFKFQHRILETQEGSI